MSSRGTLAQTYDVAAASTHDEQIAAAMAKFRMYQDSKKTGNDTQSIVATPTDEKSRKTKSSAEEASESLHRNAILSISSTQDNMSATGSVARSTSKPRSTVEAARMSLRPTIRRTSSNRSVSSMNSESFSMASSARMTSSKSGEGTPRPEEVAEAAPSHRRSSGVVSRIQKLNQDARTRAIHQSKSKFHQSLKSRPSEGIEQDEIPTIPSNSMTLPKVTSMECSVQEPFQEQASKLATTNKDGTANVSVIKGLFFIAKYILWNLPQDVAAILYGLVRFFTGRSHWTAHRKTVLLTGASTKIAAETARQLAMEGARLALVAPSPLEDLEHLAEECRELGSSKVHVYSADLTNVMSAEMTIQQAAKDFGGKFNVVMVHGQSLGQGCHFEEIQEPSEMEHMMKENVLSCMVTLHYALKYIPKTRDSRIVVTSSTLAVVASPFQTVYAASQHALSGFCNSLRMELKTTYSRKAPRVCLVIPETAGHAHDRMLSMGAVLPPTKAYSWAGTPLQHAVHDLLEAVGRGCREFGTPPYVKRWKCLSVLAPSLVDWSIVRHVQNTHYRPLEETLNGNAAAAAANVTPNMKKKEVGAQSLRRVSGGHGNASWMRQRHNAGVQAVGNKTWS
jgi:short-subunit dehydrogenase